MTQKFIDRLTEYLSSECDDYFISYTLHWEEDTQYCEVEVKSGISENKKTVNFKYNENDDDLLIELCEDSFYVTREYDQSAKYFWMLIAPALFPEN